MTQYVDSLGPALAAMRDCVSDALEASGRGAGLIHVAPGAEVAWDNCCDGQMWVRVVSIVPTGTAAQQGPCGPSMLSATIGVGVMRCAATIDSQGNPPTAQQMTDDALGMTQDAATILGSMLCCARETRTIHRLSVGTFSPQGPSGGCVGGEWTASIVIDTCGCGS